MSQSEPHMLGFLKGITPATASRKLDILSNSPVTIGSGPTCDLRFNDPTVSALHCRIYAKEIQVGWLIYCEDLSESGTQFNGCVIGKNSSVILLNGCNVCINKDISFEYQQIYPPDSPTTVIYTATLGTEYKLTETRLGSGSQSRTVVAVSTHRETEQFACKIIDLKSFEKEFVKKVVFELDILKKTRHPCILRAINRGQTQDDKTAYIVMPIYHGGTLQNFVLQRQGIPEHEIMYIFYQLVQAITYLHRRGIVHRDLKPENILLVKHQPYPRVVIADFGLADRLDETTTALCGIVGTLAYSAPELVQGQRYNEKVDDWSLGAILYFLVTGKHAFTDDSLDEHTVHELVVNGIYNKNNSNWMNASDKAKQLVARLLTVDPQQRIVSSECLRDEWFSQDLTGLERLYLSTESDVPCDPR